MNNEHEMIGSELRALDIVEAGTDLTEEQLHELRNNVALQEDVQDLLDIKVAMRMEHVDVEEQLKLFHKQHTSPSPQLPISHKPQVKLLFALAAIFIGICIVFTFWKDKKGITPDAAQEMLAKGVVFTADNQQNGISLTNEKGEQVTLSPSAQQNSTITLDDFRKIFSDKKNIESVTLNVPYGKSAAVSLPDGSTVYLHPGSKVIFPTAFIGKERVVMLEGRAYFKVSHDAAHPFIVITQQAQATVLGTEFDINTADGEVTLINGSIQVDVKEMNKKVILTPHQQVRYNLQTALFNVDEVDVVPYEYWRDGYLYFDNVELKTIMEAIGKNFNMTVEFRNEKALHYKMRFIAERNHGVQAAIDMMNRMKKVNVRVAEGKIIVE